MIQEVPKDKMPGEVEVGISLQADTQMGPINFIVKEVKEEENISACIYKLQINAATYIFVKTNFKRILVQKKKRKQNKLKNTVLMIAKKSHYMMGSLLHTKI